VKFAFVDTEKAQWPVAVLCEMLAVSRSGYYAWTTRPEPPRVQADAELVVEIKDAHKAGRGAYGSPRVVRALRKKGRRIGKNRVARLMRKEGIVGRKKKRFKKTTDSNHSDPIAPNVLERNFHVDLPDTAWVTDVTYVSTHQGWLYLAVISTCSRGAWWVGPPVRTTTGSLPWTRWPRPWRCVIRAQDSFITPIAAASMPAAIIVTLSTRWAPRRA